MAEAMYEEYWSMPPITRSYMTACAVVTLGVQLDLVTPFQLYYNPDLVYRKMQLWRLASTFCFFGPIGFSFIFNVIFTYRYCRMLEEDSFRGRTADFAYMLIFGAVFMLIAGVFVNVVFLGHALTMMLVYIWARRNPYIRMNFFGVLSFKAPYLPWVLLGFSLLLGNPVFVDVMGIVVGHLYYWLEDVLPAQLSGYRVLATPRPLAWLFTRREVEYEPLEEDERPGGWE